MSPASHRKRTAAWTRSSVISSASMGPSPKPAREGGANRKNTGIRKKAKVAILMLMLMLMFVLMLLKIWWRMMMQ